MAFVFPGTFQVRFAEAVIVIDKASRVEVLKGPLGISQVLVGLDKDGDLVLFRKFEGFVCQVESLLWGSRVEDDPGKFPVSCIENKEEVCLFGPGGQASGWPWTLYFGNHDRGFGHACQGEPFRHQGKPSSRGPCHGPDSGKGGADRHVNGCYFIFRLFDNDPVFLRF